MQGMTPWCNCTGAPPDTNKPDRWAKQQANSRKSFSKSSCREDKNSYNWPFPIQITRWGRGGSANPEEAETTKEVLNWNLFHHILTVAQSVQLFSILFQHWWIFVCEIKCCDQSFPCVNITVSEKGDEFQCWVRFLSDIILVLLAIMCQPEIMFICHLYSIPIAFS